MYVICANVLIYHCSLCSEHNANWKAKMAHYSPNSHPQTLADSLKVSPQYSRKEITSPGTEEKGVDSQASPALAYQ